MIDLIQIIFNINNEGYITCAIIINAFLVFSRTFSHFWFLAFQAATVYKVLNEPLSIINSRSPSCSFSRK